MDIGHLFCDIDDFFIDFEKQMASQPLPDTEALKSVIVPQNFIKVRL